MDVESNNKVTVTAPNTEGSGASETIFKGSRKPHQKECVLIFDHKTGEITLEKLNQNITVKRTRQQNPKSEDRAQKQMNSGRPITPIDTKKLVPQMPQTTGSQQKPNSSPLNPNRQNSPNNKQRLSPQKAGSNGHSLSQTHRSSPSMSQPISPSMPTLSSLSSMTVKPSVPSSTPTIAHYKRDTDKDKSSHLGLSDSSSDSSDQESSSSSSDDSSDSSDENPSEDTSGRKPTNSGNIFTNINNNFNKTKVNQNSDHSSSDSDSDNEFESVPNSSSSNHNGVNGSAPVLPSMPKFSQLSE